MTAAPPTPTHPGAAPATSRRLAGGLLGLALLGQPSPAAAEGIEVVQACLEANAPHHSSVQEILLQTRDALGRVSESRAKVYWRRLRDGEGRLLVRVTAPPDLAGAALLVIRGRRGRPEAWIHLPELGAPQRVYTAEDVPAAVRSDFPIEEMRRAVDVGGHATLHFVREAEAAGRPAWEIEARPDGDSGSTYGRILTFVDRATCVPLRLEFFSPADRPRKVLEVAPEDLTRSGERWMARVLVVQDLEHHVRSTVNVESIEVDVPLAPSLLTVQALAGPKDPSLPAVSAGPPDP
jgi:hypothetical protein